MKILLPGLLLVAISAKIVVGQSDSASVCRADRALTAAAAPDSFTLPPPPKKCEDGPLRTIHTVPNEFYWPPIYKGTCDKLKCKDPPCIARKTEWRTRCRLVYRIVNGCWKRIGFRAVRFLDHLKCSCKECKDITSVRQCIATEPCPNEYNPKSFCYYQRGKCDCCEPFSCPRGQFFDKRICDCVCPKGTKKVGDKCIGDCSEVNLRYCRTVLCDINPRFYCIIKNRRCACPSCDAQKSASQCPRTRCVELKDNPYCVYDKDCRCPKCSDFDNNGQQCINTYCGLYKCRYNSYSNKCFCPSSG